MTKNDNAPQYSRQKYAVIAVDVAVFSIISGELNVLLMQTNKPELKGKWALPGGLIRPEEGLEEAAGRVLEDKAGLTEVLLDQLATFGDPKRDPFGRVVSVAYLALTNYREPILADRDHYGNIAWYPVSRLPELAYDHREIIERGRERLRNKIQYSNIAKGILPEEFTLTELQDIYQIILDQPLDKRNFRKKVVSSGLVKGTGKRESGKKNRPPELYRFAVKRLTFFQLFS